jgi:hypothetical protein
MSSVDRNFKFLPSPNSADGVYRNLIHLQVTAENQFVLIVEQIAYLHCIKTGSRAFLGG